MTPVRCLLDSERARQERQDLEREGGVAGAVARSEKARRDERQQGHGFVEEAAKEGIAAAAAAAAAAPKAAAAAAAPKAAAVAASTADNQAASKEERDSLATRFAAAADS